MACAILSLEKTSGQGCDFHGLGGAGMSPEGIALALE